jgi:hypothetical protein
MCLGTVVNEHLKYQVYNQEYPQVSIFHVLQKVDGRFGGRLFGHSVVVLKVLR